MTRDKLIPMPADAYHADTEWLSAGRLKEFARSPRRYLAAINGELDSEPTPAMLLGSMIHAAILEPDTFSQHYVPKEKVDGRTKAGKAYNAQWELDNVGKLAIKRDEEELLAKLQSSLQAHELSQHLLTGDGLNEHVLQWVDEATGVKCKARPDRVLLDNGSDLSSACIDLKTTADASPKAFSKTLSNLGYWRSAVHYLSGLKHCGLPCDAYYFLCVETGPPYEVAVYEMDADALERAETRYRIELQEISECQQINEWPSLTTINALSLSLPPWF